MGIVISNLLSNAIKYHDSSKENQFVEIATWADEENYYVMVKDNGVGIAKKHQENLFNMFYTANEKAKGSGIGLFILKDAMDILKGKVSIESEFGEGTEFTISLPR